MILLSNGRDTKKLGWQLSFAVSCPGEFLAPAQPACGFHMLIGVPFRPPCSDVSWICFYAGIKTYAQTPLTTFTCLPGLEATLGLELGRKFQSLSVASELLWIDWKSLSCINRETVSWRREVTVLCLLATPGVLYAGLSGILHTKWDLHSLKKSFFLKNYVSQGT